MEQFDYETASLASPVPLGFNAVASGFTEWA